MPKLEKPPIESKGSKPVTQELHDDFEAKLEALKEILGHASEMSDEALIAVNKKLDEILEQQKRII